MHCDRIWRNAHLATLVRTPVLGLIADGLVACRDGLIVHAGPTRDAPALTATEDIDCQGRLITPGLIDCHTHLVYAGNRAHEFEQRLQGHSYADIASKGGGILSTVKPHARRE
jgi:imidazolonepropionase